MIDFPIMPEVATKSSWLFCGTLYFLILLLNKHWALSPSYGSIMGSKRYGFVVLVYVYCLLAFYCGDWAHLQTIVQDSVGSFYQEGQGLEWIYHFLANALGGNYLMFRVIVWGIGLICMFQSFKKSDLDPYRSLFFLFGIYISAFAYSRAGCALALFYFGFVLLFQDRDKRSKIDILLGIGLIFASAFSHRSLLALVILTPLALFPIKRKTMPLSIILIILIGFFWRLVLARTMNILMGSEEYMHRIELYEGINGGDMYVGGLSGFFFLWYKAIVHVPFWFCVVCLYKEISKGRVPFHIQAVFRFSIFLYFFSMMMLVMYGPASAFYYRYEGMLYIPITIMISYLFQNRLIRVSTYSLIFWMCALSQGKDFIYRIFFW